jgi:hypothetical protein
MRVYRAAVAAETFCHSSVHASPTVPSTLCSAMCEPWLPSSEGRCLVAGSAGAAAVTVQVGVLRGTLPFLFQATILLAAASTAGSRPVSC